MGTLHGRAGKRKREKGLRENRIVSQEVYGEMGLSAKVELIRQLIPLGLMHVQETLQEEVTALCGAGRHERREGRAAVRKASGKRGVLQRCTWHKRENVVRLLAKEHQPRWRQRLSQAYDRPTYTEASAALRKLHSVLEDINQSATNSLLEGMEETLTLHRLGLYPLIGTSFKTTNCIESVNSLIEERCSKVDAWRNSNQKHRWLAAALLDIEPRLRRVRGYRHLPLLRIALQGQFTETLKPKAA